MTAAQSSELVQRLRNLHAHSGDPDTVAEAATTLENLEGVRAERDVLQEIVDEQRAQIAKLVERIVELTEEVSSVTEDRRHAVAALSEQVDTARAERDEARREVCELRCNPPERFIGLPHELAKVNGWDCYKENTNEK